MDIRKTARAGSWLSRAICHQIRSAPIAKLECSNDAGASCHMAQTRPRPGNSFGPSKPPTIIAHSALYRCECEPRGGIYPLAADQCCGRRIPRGSRGEEFFGDHPPALSLSCSTALGNLGQAHCDHTLGVKPDVQHIDPKLPVGMGLSICRSIIEAHGARLWASPNVPRGAIFRFIAPAHPAAAS